MHRLAHRPFLRPATGATRSPLRRAAALCTALVSLSAAAARAQVTHCLPADPVWTWANPLPHGQALTQTRWVPEISAFVAVGDAAMSSPDGAAWTRLHGFPPDMMRDFWWNGTTAVAVGEDPTGFFGALFAPAAFVSTIAAAPSLDGHDSRKCSGSHSIGDSFTFSIEMSWMCRCAFGLRSAFWRSFTATFQPMCSGAPLLRM